MSYHASIYAHSPLDLASILCRVMFLCSELCIVVQSGRRRPGEERRARQLHVPSWTALCRGLYSYIIHTCAWLIPVTSNLLCLRVRDGDDDFH